MELKSKKSEKDITLKRKVIYIALFILSIYLVSCMQGLCYSKSDARYWYHRGDIKFNAKKYGEAKECFSKAIEINSNYEEAYFKRGEVYFRLAEYEKAISDFTKVIELNPNNAEAYFKRGRVCHRKEDYSSAIVDYSESLRIAPNEIKIYAYRGWAYEKIDRKDKAVEDCRKGCELGDFESCVAIQRY